VSPLLVPAAVQSPAIYVSALPASYGRTVAVAWHVLHATVIIDMT